MLTLEGNVNVSDFQYLPAINNPKIANNQIRNTALGSIKFEKPIDRIFKEAVFKELRFVGVKLDSANLTLSGNIEEFLIDDLGYSVDWTLRVKYIVTEKSSGHVVYETVKSTEQKTNKFANVFAALNETIKLSIDDLIKDSTFANNIK